VVTLVNDHVEDYPASMHVWLSQSPYGGSPNDQTSYQVIHLTNLITFAHSWEVITGGFKENPHIVDAMLARNENVDNMLQADGKFTDKDFGLNKSQRDAVESCFSASECSKHSVRLIWGPPGTGKTKTASVFLLMILKSLRTHRTLVCAPTDTDLVQLASRFVCLLEESTETSYLLADVIMFGSNKHMDTNNNLSKILLDHRAKEKHARNKLLENAKLVFCTPCGSSRLTKNQQYDTLVIDEAAYLKECESLIPLAIRGIKHVVLIGDDKQLQPVVKSPVCLHYKTI